MPVYTRRLGALVTSTASWEIIYTVPSGFAVVVRDILIVNRETTAASSVQLAVFSSGLPETVVIGEAVDVARGTVHVDLRLALEAGDQLGIFTDPPPVHVYVTGYVFND